MQNNPVKWSEEGQLMIDPAIYRLARYGPPPATKQLVSEMLRLLIGTIFFGALIYLMVRLGKQLKTIENLMFDHLLVGFLIVICAMYALLANFMSMLGMVLGGIESGRFSRRSMQQPVEPVGLPWWWNEHDLWFVTPKSSGAWRIPAGDVLKVQIVPLKPAWAGGFLPGCYFPF